LTNGRLEFLTGSLQDLDSLERLVQGVYAVIHCAGAVRGLTQAQFDAVNRDGVVHLVHAAASQPTPPRFLSLSSLAAREPHLSHYAASKRKGEAVLIEQAKTMEWTVLRPPAVYGPGDRELLPLLRWMSRGIGLLLGAKEARVSLLYVDDLAAAVEKWLSKDPCPQGVFELHDGHIGGYTWPEVANTVSRVCAKPVRHIHLTAALLQMLALGSMTIGRLGGPVPMLTLGKVREIRHDDWVCDNAAVTAAMGWEPSISLAEGLRRTLNSTHCAAV
jgi:nucleoside-diphosphate-sugar epimerase